MGQWSDEQKTAALAIAETATIREASEQTGIPEGTIKRWRSELRAAAEPNPCKVEPVEPALPVPAEEPGIGPRPVGRPSKYRDEYAEQAFKLCLLGATDADLANFFSVEEKTINNWKLDFPDFLQSIKAGKDQADTEVANRLYMRALGYSHPEEKIFQYEGEAVRVPTRKHYPPDTKAAIFWLKNRQPGKWRDRQDIEGKLTIEDNPFVGMTTEELRQLVQPDKDTVN